MADETNIVGELDDKQFKDAEIDADITKRKDTVHRANIKLLDAKQKEMMKKGLPFCYRCAKLDMEKEQGERFKMPGYARKYKIEKNVPYKLDIKKYADPKHFKLIGETLKTETKRMNGDRIDYDVKFLDYQCLTRTNSHVSVEQRERAK